jgi:hypothetical protein
MLLKERDKLEDVEVDGCIILYLILKEMHVTDVSYIHPTQDRL